MSSTAQHSTHFFREMESFRDFVGVLVDGHYRSPPEDWCLVIADVKDSTLAIESGRYKEVNSLGAAVIAIAQNHLKSVEIPYVFGGDGATMMIPNEFRETLTEKLASLKNHAIDKLGLQLRVGIVDLIDIISAGHAIDIAKLEIFPGKSVAIFRGGGLNYADKLVKSESQSYEIPESTSSEVDLDGLSCRWNAIPNTNGCVLSLMVLAHGAKQKETYAKLFKKLHTVFSGHEVHPVRPSKMTYRSMGDCIRDEIKFHSKLGVSWFTRRLEIIASVLIFKWKLPPVLFNPRRYAEAIRSHSDYQKFDDMLRMVVDCSLAQVEELQRYLESARGRGLLTYGMHQSETSLMTCYVQSVSDGDHIHFIDGGDGGYAMAAKQMKSQIIISPSGE